MSTFIRQRDVFMDLRSLNGSYSPLQRSLTQWQCWEQWRSQSLPVGCGQRSIGVGDGGPKFWENIHPANVMKNSAIFEQMSCKIRVFCYFLFKDIFSGKNVLPPKLTQLQSSYTYAKKLRTTKVPIGVQGTEPRWGSGESCWSQNTICSGRMHFQSNIEQWSIHITRLIGLQLTIGLQIYGPTSISPK